MAKNRKIYVIGGNDHYAHWMQGEIVDRMEDSNLVCGVGGADWHPSWYCKEEPHPTVGTDYELDVYERAQFKRATGLGIPIIGICRSSQGLCVYAGGELVQHQVGQDFIHPMSTYTGNEINVSSTHHQSQFPFRRLKEGNDYKLLGWTQNTLRCRWLNKHEQADKILPEVEDCYYPKIRALGIQGHPEMLGPQHVGTIKYYQRLLDRLVENKL